MPRLPGWAWLLLAIAFATLASYMALGWLKRQAAVKPPVQEKSTIVVVAKIGEKAKKNVVLNYYLSPFPLFPFSPTI
jgi:hypothetical protein